MVPQQLESARDELLLQLRVPVASAPSEAVAATAAAAAAVRPLPEVADVALGLIKAARHVRGSDWHSCDDSSWDSEDDEALEEQQGPGPASNLQSPSTTPVQLSGDTIGILETYRNGSLETRKQLLRDSLCVLALSSLQPRPVPHGRGHDGATSCGASGCGLSDGGASGCSDGGCVFWPSPAVLRLQIDRMSLHVFHDWAELTLVESKTCSKGRCKRRHWHQVLEPSLWACLPTYRQPRPPIVPGTCA